MKRVQKQPEPASPLLRRLACAGLAALAISNSALASTEGGASAEPLDPEVAFVPTAKRIDAKSIEITYAIAPGHYMYRDRFRVNSADGKFHKPTQMPSGRVTEDPTFGRVETYRERVRFSLNARQFATGTTGVTTVKLVGQGCAEAGICYPPMTHQFALSGEIGSLAPGVLTGSGFGIEKSSSKSSAMNPADRNSSSNKPLSELFSAPAKKTE